MGIVVSREVSRLSRTDKDWCRLVEVCQIFGTLIGDEQQVYDLNYLDDQLVLGINRPDSYSTSYSSSRRSISCLEIHLEKQLRLGQASSQAVVTAGIPNVRSRA